MLDASCRGLGRSTPSTCDHPTVDEYFCLLSAAFTIPPLNSTQYYLPPGGDAFYDVTCDCNTVMYRYCSHAFQGWHALTNSPVFSLYMACASCQGGYVYS